jgi:hypothetical protein
MKDTNSRLLGVSEKLFWVLDQANKVHFTMAMEISGEITVPRLRAALNAVQARHPLFSSYIAGNGYKYPSFHQVVAKEIPLRVVKKSSAEQLDIELSEEMYIPFDWTQAPLIRAVLIKDPQAPAIILTAHHAVSDGMSMVLVFRDLLQALSGKPLAPLQLPPSIDDILGLSEQQAITSPEEENISLLQMKQLARPQVSRLKLSTDLTTRLLKRSREEISSVHGALSAALIRALRKSSANWDNKPVRVRHPSSIRTTLGVTEDSGVYLNAKIITTEHLEAETFWDLARYTKNELRHMKTMATVKEGITMLRGHFFNDMDPQIMLDHIQHALACEMMISNLGQLPYAPDFGDLKIVSLWGPLSLGTPEEQTIGIATTNGSITITVASLHPLNSLLQIAEQELKEACS